MTTRRKDKPRNLMEAVLMAKPGPPVTKLKVWVQFDIEDQFDDEERAVIYAERTFRSKNGRAGAFVLATLAVPLLPPKGKAGK